MNRSSNNKDKCQRQAAAMTVPFPQCRTVIVCARNIRPAARLQRIFEHRPDIEVVDTRNLSAAERELVEAPDAALVVAINEEWLDRLLDRLPHLFGIRPAALYPRARCFAVLPEPLSAFRLLLREAGVADLVSSSQDLPILGRSIARHFELTPPKQKSLPNRILASLPWS